MFAKILIKLNINVLTGMHIGGSDAFSAIGAVDSPVIKDAVTKLPIIPGSSIKGKLRTLLARSIENDIYLQEPNKDKIEIKRLFGSSEKDNIIKARLQFSDAFMIKEQMLGDAMPTEVKFENTINRATAVANPRQIERVVRGTVFELAIVYDADKQDEIAEDFENISKALKLLQMDYLGGHGTRGYGRVKFGNFKIDVIDGGFSEEEIEKLSTLLKDVEKYEILSFEA